MDGVVPYRLEMQAKATAGGCRNLYEFWGDDLYREVMDDSRILINLASKEYSKCIEKYLRPEDRYITCVFGELAGEKVVQKGVYAKMARGETLRPVILRRRKICFCRKSIEVSFMDSCKVVWRLKRRLGVR
jgi:cytoplasmic iron level regulating protein YaaA (DUF328/UPF0246 family)